MVGHSRLPCSLKAWSHILGDLLNIDQRILTHRVGSEDWRQVSAEVAHIVKEALQEGRLGCKVYRLHQDRVLQDVAAEPRDQRQRGICQPLDLCTSPATQFMLMRPDDQSRCPAALSGCCRPATYFPNCDPMIYPMDLRLIQHLCKFCDTLQAR